MAGLLGIKVGMTQIFREDGVVVPITVVQAGPCAVLEVFPEKGALKLGYGEVKMEKLKKPRQGYFKKLNLPPRRYTREIKFENVSGYQPGQEISVSLFKAGDYVDVTGVSKGKGFAGMIKRWGAHRQPMTHGHTEHRRTGSIGASASPGRVLKGKKMPGRLGGRRKTVQNLQVAAVRETDNLILIKGAVPGCRSGFLIVKKALKKTPSAKPGK